MFNETVNMTTNMANMTTNISTLLNNGSNDSLSEIEFYQTHIPTVVLISRILPPIWWFFGIVGNIIALIVWLQPKMRHSSGFYLAALAITDLIFLLLNILYEVHFTYDKLIMDTSVVCEWFAISYYSVQHLSPIFVLAFTVERYLSVCHPFRMVNINQNQSKTTLVTIGILSFLIVGINAAHGYFWTINTTVTGTEEKSECDLRLNMNYDVFRYWSWVTEMLIFAAVPLTVLVLNILVIIEMKKISTLEKKNMRTNSIDRRSTTIMLLGVSFYQILTVLPVAIIYALWVRYKPPMDYYPADSTIVDSNPKWQGHIRYYAAKIIMQNVGLSHYAANFYIYLLTGKIFRKQLYEMVAVLFCNKRLKYLSKGRTGYTRTTRMSLTSHRGSILRGRQNSCPQSPGRSSDPCNNDIEQTNKNSLYSMAELETLDPTSHQGYSTAMLPSKQIGPNAHLLTCVEETDDADANETSLVNKDNVTQESDLSPTITAEANGEVANKTRN